MHLENNVLFDNHSDLVGLKSFSRKDSKLFVALSLGLGLRTSQRIVVAYMLTYTVDSMQRTLLYATYADNKFNNK